jgi:predicted nucleic acid-binding protein
VARSLARSRKRASPKRQSLIAEASRRIGNRDPDDIPILALALALSIPLWSNDKDFKDAGVEWYTTERLLRLLRIIDHE